jgi:hypothetical protein
MHFSACISGDWVAEAVLSGWLDVCCAAVDIRKSGAAQEPNFVSCNDVFLWPLKLHSSGVKSVLSKVHVRYYFPVRLHWKQLEQNKYYLLSD